MRLLLALRVLGVVALAGCLEQHDAQTQVLAKDYCYGCHVGEYDATGTTAFPAAPAHATTSCSTQCALCHTTQTWVNQLGGCLHPEAAFPLVTKGKHLNLKCISCHSDAISLATGATSVKGANTDCIACHPNDNAQQNYHVGAIYETGAPPSLIGQPYAYSSTDHRFCLDCHPAGLAIGHQPGDFRIPHHGAACTKCHDAASGLGKTNGADVHCSTSGCHSPSIDADGSEHSNPDTGHHPKCLNCHRG
jgi:hypothetical protein